MPSPPAVAPSDIGVGVLLLRGTDTLLLARPGGTGPYELTGGPVPAAGGVDVVVEKVLAGLDRPPTSTRFLGCVEQQDGGHALHVVFVAEMDPISETPAGLVEMAAADLPGIELQPRALSSVLQRWLAERKPVWQGAFRGDTAARRGVRESLRSQLFAVRTELRSGSFRDASVAMCALVAAADGRIDPAERAMLIDYITTDDVMSHFPSAELTQQFEDHLDRLQRDFAAGKAAALKEIVKVRKRPVEARAVIQVGIVMGCSDGWFDDTEKAVVREAVQALDLDLIDFPIDDIQAGAAAVPSSSEAQPPAQRENLEVGHE